MESIVRQGAQTPQKKNTGLKIGVAVLIVLIAAVCVVVGLAFSDPYRDRGLETIQPSDRLATVTAASVLTGKENSFSIDDVNAYLAYRFQQDTAKGQGADFQVKAVEAIDFSGSSADIYLPVVFRGKSIGVSFNVTPSLDAAAGELRFQVNSAHVGRLPVPVDPVLRKAEAHLPEDFRLDGHTVVCRAPSLKISALGVTASASLTEMKLGDGTLNLEAKAKLTLG